MHQALPEPPSLRLPPIYGPPPRQQPGPSHHQFPQSLPPPPRREALPPPLPQRLPPIPTIPPRQPLPQSDSDGQSHGIPHFLPPPPRIGRHEGNQHRRIIQWLGVSPQNPIVLISTNTQDASQFPEYMDREVNPDFDFDDLHYSDIEQSDLNDPPSPSNEGLLSSHPHTPSIISQQSIHPPSTPGLDAARASQIPVGAHLEHHGLMRLDLPVSPLSGADPDDPGNDDPPPSQPSPPHTPPPVQNPDPSQPSPSPPHTPPPPPVQNVPHHGRPCGPWQKKVTFDDCAFLQPYEAERDDFYQQLHFGQMSCRCHHCGALHWLEECIFKSSKVNPCFGQCCNHGKVVLPLLS